ncbi:MAG: hypothetical protein ACREKR_04020 [Candidatus Methylomirabilales bacterium]
MTREEFRELLQQHSDVELLDPCLRDDQAPYVFQPKPAAWDSFRDELVALLGVSRDEVRVVGSGRFGFSIKPWNNFKRFGDKSDIDVVIVNANLFDELWLALLDAAYPRPPITDKLGGWLEKRRNELYTGWLTPLKIKLDYRIVGLKARPVLEFSTLWFDALKRAARHPPRRHEDITGRLYRTWRHAELYHLNSLSDLRRALAE